ncbi:Uncharacterized protein Rs2_18936 [Raphanus sativus]|nr:Uncharacterized protein Rs2_18936 [Raphanus sativus]
MARKCLDSRTVEKPCGFPLLPVAALETNLWNQSETFFNCELQAGEAERNWIFYGPIVNSHVFRSVWSCYKTEVVHGFGMTKMVHYLQKIQRSTTNGMFRLTAYHVPGIQPKRSMSCSSNPLHLEKVVVSEGLKITTRKLKFKSLPMNMKQAPLSSFRKRPKGWLMKFNIQQLVK